MQTYSESLFLRAQKVVPGGVHSPVRAFRGVGGVPRFIESASGVHLEDIDGNCYVDYCMALGPLIFGHQDPDVKAAVQQALNRGWVYGTAEPYSLELAEMLTQRLTGIDKVRFVSSGTEAVLSALRVARAVTGRNKILKFEGCYHGHVDALLVKAGSGLTEFSTPDSAGVSQAIALETCVAPLNSLESVRTLFEREGEKIAAVILEPLPANYGLLLQEKEFVLEVMRIARSNGSLVIFDEVITGFRVGFGGMAEQWGVVPDLVTYGKILGGGFPFGAYGGKGDYMDWVAPSGPVYQAGTLSAHPLSVVAGMTTLRKLIQQPPYYLLSEKTAEFVKRIESVAAQAGVPIQVQHYGSLFWMVFQDHSNSSIIRSVADIPPGHRKRYPKLFHGFLNQGIYLPPSAFEVCFLTTLHTREHLDQYLKVLKGVLEATDWAQNE